MFNKTISSLTACYTLTFYVIFYFLFKSLLKFKLILLYTYFTVMDHKSQLKNRGNKESKKNSKRE